MADQVAQAGRLHGLKVFSGLEIQQRFAALHIERHRGMVVRDEPIAFDLPKAGRPPKPELIPVPVLQRAAEPIQAVPECDVIAQGDREIAYLVTEGRLVRREYVHPVRPLSLQLPRAAAGARCRMTRCPERKSTSRPRYPWRELPPPACRFAVECRLRQFGCLASGRGSWIPSSSGSITGVSSPRIPSGS